MSVSTTVPLQRCLRSLQNHDPAARGELLVPARRRLQRLANRMFRARSKPASCLTRPALKDESTLLQRYLQEQTTRLERNDLDAAAIAGSGDNVIPRVAWTLVVRALLNLDEAISK